jgi:broad specificity phosphatase PhoE
LRCDRQADWHPVLVSRPIEHLLFIARHGETDWNRVGRWQGRTDIPLSARGRTQALALAASLRGREIAAVHASDLLRASETAAIVARELGVAAPGLDARLRERGFGCFEGLTRAECADRHPDAWARYLADRRATPPDGEAHPEVAARMLAALTDIARTPRSAREATLVISHGGAIRIFIQTVTGAYPPPLENGALFRVRYAGERFVSVTPAIPIAPID